MIDPPARVARITPDQWTEGALEVFGVLTGPQFNADQSKNHVLATFAHYPELTAPFLRFNKHLLAATSLPLRLRQIAIQRVAWVRKCTYMWSSHLRVSLPIGLTRDDFEALKVGAASPHWSPFERTLVAAVDELVERSQMSDAAWEALGAEFDLKQIMDLLFTVGCYAALTMVFNSLRVDREPELQALGDEYGAP
jgi:4-carboxymuconolactone decarboxylase